MDQPKPEDIERSLRPSRSEVEKAEVKLRAFERSENAESRAQSEFRQELNALDSHQKGSWGERAVINEADKAGHAVLVDHWDKPTGQGFDCISYDPKAAEVHIWEVKNYGLDTHAVSSKDVTAWQDQKLDGSPRDGYQRNWEEVVHSVPDGLARHTVKQAINEGRVTFHLRVGPDTKVTPEFQNELNNANVPGAKYDWARYTYDDMLKIGSGV